MAVQQARRVTLLLAEGRDQNVGDPDFLLAAELGMEHGTLQHPL